MRDKRTLNRVCRQLDKSKPEESLIYNTIQWVMGVGEIENVLPRLSEPKSKLSKETYMYGEETMVWATEDFREIGAFFISKTIPAHTPRKWWIKQTIDGITSLSLGDEYLPLPTERGGTISWVEVEPYFQEYRAWFDTREEVYTYLGHYVTIDTSDQVMLSPQDRKTKMLELNCVPRWLQKRLLEEGLERIYLFKKGGQEFWAMRKNTSLY